MRHAKIPVNSLLCVTALLLPNHDYFRAVKASHPTNNCRIIAKSTVTMDLTPVGENTLDIVERIWTLRMPRQFCFHPRWARSRRLCAQCLYSIVQFLDLTPRIVVLSVYGLKFDDLPLDFFQLLLCFRSQFHRNAVTIPRYPPGFHHRDKEVGR